MSDTTDALELITAERIRQITEEGWDAAHDDHHEDGALTVAAICYARIRCPHENILRHSSPVWPWSAKWWKPSKDRKRNLIKAGALIAAELDRLLRDEQQKQEPQS